MFDPTTISTAIFFSILGMFGVVFHNLMNLNGINRRNNGNVDFAKYWRLERFTIFISILGVLLVSFLLNKEYHYALEYIGLTKWVGFGMVFVGYFAQSLLIHFMGKGEKYAKLTSNEESNIP